jgi:translation initiation factor IF-2
MHDTRTIQRPPIVVVLGHVDHGKSSLLDYIRKSNVVAGEAGGITQHTAAYEVVHTDAKGVPQKITFIDTPGHEAFAAQRARGARVADIAILVVSAEDGVKAQTKEAHQAIVGAKIPFVVAINKIDAPNADLDRTVSSLIENGIYLEGFGGSVPFVPISAKRGDGIPALLELILLVTELEELTGNPDVSAEGIIIEAHRDAKKGTSATFIITNGTLSKGMAVAAGACCAPVRVMYDFNEQPIESATFSSPVTITGWNDIPHVGDTVAGFATKKEAEASCVVIRSETTLVKPMQDIAEDDERAILPVVIKADVAGSLDAIAHEIEKIKDERVLIKILRAGVGPIAESDITIAGGDARTVIIGFNTTVESEARFAAERLGMEIHTENIIYRLSEWLGDIVVARRPKQSVQEVHGEAKILRYFSAVKTKQVIGGKVEDGMLKTGDTVAIIRREEEIGTGKIVELQKTREEVKTVDTGTEFGARIDASVTLAVGDRLHSFTMVSR